jgi:PAS domain S-box-containing protein
MKILIRSLFWAFILNFFMPLGAQSASEAPAKKTVLALFPYQNDVPYSVLAMQTIKDEFGSARDLSLDLYYEYLDLNRFPGKDYQQQILNLYTTKYGHKSIDLVIVATEVVLNFWLEHRAEIAPTPPVVFCDVQTGRLPTLQLPPDVTGVSGVLNHLQSVEWLLRARPEVREIVTVHGVGPMDQRDMQALGTLQEVLRGRVKFTDLSDLPLVEIKRRVAALPRSSAVVYHLMFEDAAGKRYRPVDALRELAAASTVPVIGGFDHYIGFGTVGGYMYSMEQQTRQASQMGLSILRGKPVSAIPISKDQSNRFIFDHLALQRYDIPLSLLPPGSIIKNRQYSFWELYKPQIIAMLAAFAVLIILVIFLLLLTRKLSKTRLALANLNVNLEAQVQERTATLGQTNRHLENEITERKHAEEKLIHIMKAVESASDAIGISDPQGHHFYQNKALSDLFGYTTAEEFEAAGGGPAVVKDPSVAKEMFDNIMHGKSWVGELEMVTKSGHVFTAFERADAIKDNEGNVIGLVGIITDITDRKKAEEGLKHKESYNYALFEYNPDQAIAVDLNGKIIAVNLAKRVSGDRLPKIGDVMYRDYAGNHEIEMYSELMECLGSGELKVFPELKYRGKILLISIAPFSMGAVIISHDITDRKLSEEKVKASLLEKETMLKEIHHRVKNNLQVISSLLNMQSSHLQDEKAKEALQASMARVRTMAMIHTQLYQSQDLARVDFGLFIRDLISNISQSYGRAVSPVEIHVDAGEISLGIDNSIPCGLILNELVSNALKHAFPEGEEGEINIRMRSEDKRVTLTVQDNGIGFPGSIDLTNLKSLGLELVNLLVGQINGKIDMRVDGGTTWTITFPLKNEREWQNG